MKPIVILGATGSIGANTLSVIRNHPESFTVAGLAVKRHDNGIDTLLHEFPDADLAVANPLPDSFEPALRNQGWNGTLFHGENAASDLVRTSPATTCVAGISGTAGLRPAFAAAEKGMRILLANKEVLVSAGPLFMDAVAAGGASVLPVDSEHAALWQCLESRPREDIRRLVITASGGPFRTRPPEDIEHATPAEALRHPVWSMGPKISIDSATLANKVLELIEAQHLFGLPPDALDILVHPQSVVHGMVEFVDGGVLAHMGVSDMRQPIAYMLFHPERPDNFLPRLDLAKIGALTFENPDPARYPILNVGLDAARRGGRCPAFFNAANETAVELFLAGRIPFGGIARAVAAVMPLAGSDPISSLGEVLEIHDEARRAVIERAG